MLNGHLLRGVYLITPDIADTTELLRRARPLLALRPALLQYRNKQADAALRHEQAAALLAACREHRVGLIINDDVELAAKLGAAGVHVGEDDADPATLRARLGADGVIGVSCYDSLQRARDAAAAGASYVAFGAFHPTLSKATTRRASLSLLRDATEFGLPCAAIGGILPEHAPSLVAAGADLIAVIGGVFAAPDPHAALMAYQAAFSA